MVRDDADRIAFVDRLASVVAERGWLLVSWVLMTNHLHLIVETPVPNLSDGMRDLLTPFAQRFNAVHRRALSRAESGEVRPFFFELLDVSRRRSRSASARPLSSKSCLARTRRAYDDPGLYCLLASYD
ncbi:MAG: hypothetical protein LC732_05290, partial [Acidobacteria bacterium]|nr:hypothetical protein [Acidobacteriota bacterium]